MNEKALAWCMFFSAVKGWQYHPGNEANKHLTTRACANVADEMLAEYIVREEERWDGWQPRK